MGRLRRSAPLFVTGATATIGGKSVSVAFKDMNTLTVVTPALSTGPQRLTITNPEAKPSPWTPLSPPIDATQPL